MNFNELVDKIVVDLRSGSFAVLCGAGISISSGLPSVIELVSEILINTQLKPNEREKIIKIVPSRLPFERLIEVILDTMDEVAQKQLLEVFSLGNPNIYHLFLARLARLGMLKTICTTNFDTHIETALDNEGLERGKNYKVYQTIEQFSKIDWNFDIIHVIKLHGSVESPEKLAITVSSVAAPGSVSQVHGVLSHIFENSNHTGLLVMGYSFSDKFDISQVITQIGMSGSNMQIINMQFTFDTDYEIDKIKNEGENIHPLTAFENHFCLNGNTKEVVKELCLRLGFGDLDISKPISDWQYFLKNFFDKLDKKHVGIAGYHIAGSLLTMIGADNEAIPYYAHVEEIANKSDNARWKLIALQSLAGAFINIGDVENGLNALKKAEPLASGLKEGNFLDHIHSLFGRIYSLKGDSNYQRSLQFYNTALDIAKKEGDSIRCIPHLSGIANCWMKLGDFDAAKQANEYALQILENSGDLYRKVGMLGDFASEAYISRDYKSALEWYEKAQKMSELCGDAEKEGIHTMNLANVYVKLKQYDNAFECYSKSRKILEGIGTNSSILQLLNNHELYAKRLFEKS